MTTLEEPSTMQVLLKHFRTVVGPNVGRVVPGRDPIRYDAASNKMVYKPVTWGPTGIIQLTVIPAPAGAYEQDYVNEVRVEARALDLDWGLATRLTSRVLSAVRHHVPTIIQVPADSGGTVYMPAQLYSLIALSNSPGEIQDLAFGDARLGFTIESRWRPL